MPDTLELAYWLMALEILERFFTVYLPLAYASTLVGLVFYYRAKLNMKPYRRAD